MRYSVFAGGKRFRPILCLETARALGCPARKAFSFACAVELVHTFTLIHDDLPAMDDSDLRRGKPTCHKVFGEALAILAGDGLNTLSFKLIADHPSAVKELAAALLEVVAGQVVDILSAGRKMSLRQLREVHRWKTAALLKACVRGSALICGAGSAQLRALTAYAGHLGLAFQITDDILDVTASRQQLGKPVGADRRKGFPYFLGLERSRRLAERERRLAIRALEPLREKSADLRRLADYVVERGN